MPIDDSTAFGLSVSFPLLSPSAQQEIELLNQDCGSIAASLQEVGQEVMDDVRPSFVVLRSCDLGGKPGAIVNCIGSVSRIYNLPYMSAMPEELAFISMQCNLGIYITETLYQMVHIIWYIRINEHKAI